MNKINTLSFVVAQNIKSNLLYHLVLIYLCMSGATSIAQVIDFESYPDGSNTVKGHVITNQYLLQHGVTFSVLDENWELLPGSPQIIEVGVRPPYSYSGPQITSQNCSTMAEPIINTPSDSEYENVGCKFLGFGDLLSSGESTSDLKLVVSYSVGVLALSGVLMDIDAREVWEVKS